MLQKHQFLELTLGVGSNIPIFIRLPGSTEDLPCRAELAGLEEGTPRILLIAEAAEGPGETLDETETEESPTPPDNQVIVGGVVNTSEQTLEETSLDSDGDGIPDDSDPDDFSDLDDPEDFDEDPK